MKPNRSRPSHQSDVDLTPMLDIVFIMLIFFIVTASFMKESGLAINHPSSSTPAQPRMDKPVIGFQIDAANRLLFEGRHVDIWAAEAIIKQQSTLTPEAPVVMAIEQGATLKTMIRLYDAALLNGIPHGKIAVITSPAL